MSTKIKGLDDLTRIRDEARRAMDVRSLGKEIRITVHMGTCGIASGAREVVTSLADILLENKVQNVSLRESGCVGLCDQEPMLSLMERTGRTYMYGRLDRQRVQEIVREHVVNGNPLPDYLVRT